MSEPNDCPRLMEAQALWEGELDGGRAAEVRRHLEACACCRAASEEWARLSALLVRGDPAAALVVGPLPRSADLPVGDDGRRPAAARERRQRMKEELLAVYSASLEETSSVAPQSATRLHACPGWRSARIALALVPPALAALWLVHAGRNAPSGRSQSSSFVSRLDTPASRRKAQSLPRRPILALAPERPKLTAARGKVRSTSGSAALERRRGESRSEAAQARHSGKIRRPFLTSRPAASSHPTAPAGATVQQRRPVRPRAAGAFRLVAGPQVWPSGSTRRRPVALAPRDKHAAPRRRLDDGRPIERLVIQVDNPPPAPLKTVTHLTIIAAGDLKAPGAQLTIVKSEKEEALP